MLGKIWGDAKVTYPDWVGTAQLDQRMTGPDSSLETVVGLDPDAWFIVGIDIGGGETRHSLRVVAVERSSLEGVDGLAGLVAANNGILPVTEFLVHDVDPYEVLRRVTHMFELRLRPASLVGAKIEIAELDDIPEQS